MPRFPKKEAEIIALAERMIAGLLTKPVIYPHSPHPAMHLGTGIRWKVRQYNNRHEDLVTALAAAEEATIDKNDAFKVVAGQVG